MRIGFHYHIPACLDNGRIRTMALQGLFLDSLAKHAEKLILFLHAPAPIEMHLMDYTIEADNVEWVDIGEHTSLPRRIWNAGTSMRAVDTRINAVDVLLFRAPSPLLPLIIKRLPKAVQLAYLVVGEASESLNDLRQPWWRKQLIRQFILWNEGRQHHFASKAAVIFSNSAPLVEKYKKLNPNTLQVRTTTLRETDFLQVEDRCQSGPIQLLYTGRIESGKGLLTLAAAAIRLIQTGTDCRLNVVGWSEKGDTTLEASQQLFETAGLASHFTFHGKKKAGPELFEYYRNADIYVLPSQISEGFPRTIWEAMAHSVPVISTPVGSIGQTLTDGENALFIRPGDMEQTAAQIKRLVEDADLRKRLINNAFELAKASTLEQQSLIMYETLRSYVA